VYENQFLPIHFFHFLGYLQNKILVLEEIFMVIEIDGMGACQIEGIKYPAVGFGTYPLKDEICVRAITEASEVGYRIIDTATYYENFIAIGNALKPFGREDFYIISKVWPDAQTPEGLRKDIEKTLAQLQTSYLDAYLLHWPNNKIPIECTLSVMENFRRSGLIRHIGLSNVNINHMKRVLTLNIPISWVQVEMNPLFYDSELLKFCQEQSIAIQAWAPLGRGRIHEDAVLNRLGEKYGKTANQIALKWIIQHRCIPLPGSKNKDHMQQNIDIADFMFSPEEMEEIDNKAMTGQRKRITQADKMGFTDEFDFTYEECWPQSVKKSAL
jgi:diketogulonate reductase-like aldo/keto reductase